MSWILVAMADLAALCRRRSRELAKLAAHFATIRNNPMAADEGPENLVLR